MKKVESFCIGFKQSINNRDVREKLKPDWGKESRDWTSSVYNMGDLWEVERWYLDKFWSTDGLFNVDHAKGSGDNWSRRDILQAINIAFSRQSASGMGFSNVQFNVYNYGDSGARKDWGGYLVQALVANTARDWKDLDEFIRIIGLQKDIWWPENEKWERASWSVTQKGPDRDTWEETYSDNTPRLTQKWLDNKDKRDRITLEFQQYIEDLVNFAYRAAGGLVGRIVNNGWELDEIFVGAGPGFPLPSGPEKYDLVVYSPIDRTPIRTVDKIISAGNIALAFKKFLDSVYNAAPEKGEGDTRRVLDRWNEDIVKAWYKLTVPGGGKISASRLTPAQIQRLHTLGWDPAEIVISGDSFTVRDLVTNNVIAPSAIGFMDVNALGEKKDFEKDCYWNYFFIQNTEHSNLFGLSWNNDQRKVWKSTGLNPVTTDKKKHNSEADQAWNEFKWRSLLLKGPGKDGAGKVRDIRNYYTIDYTSWGVDTDGINLLGHSKEQVDRAHKLWQRLNDPRTNDVDLIDGGSIDREIARISNKDDDLVPYERKSYSLQNERERIVEERKIMARKTWKAAMITANAIGPRKNVPSDSVADDWYDLIVAGGGGITNTNLTAVNARVLYSNNWDSGDIENNGLGQPRVTLAGIDTDTFLNINRLGDKLAALLRAQRLAFRAAVNSTSPTNGVGTTRPAVLTSSANDTIIDKWFDLTISGRGGVYDGNLVPAYVQRLYTRGWDPIDIITTGNNFTVRDPATGAAVIPAIIGFNAVDNFGEKAAFSGERFWTYFFEQSTSHKAIFGTTVSGSLTSVQVANRNAWKASGLSAAPTTVVVALAPAAHNSPADTAWGNGWQDLTVGGGNPTSVAGRVTVLVPVTRTFTYASHGQVPIAGINPLVHKKNSLDIFNSLRKRIDNATLPELQDSATISGSIKASIANLATVHNVTLPVGSRSTDLENLRVRREAVLTVNWTAFFEQDNNHTILFGKAGVPVMSERNAWQIVGLDTVPTVPGNHDSLADKAWNNFNWNSLIVGGGDPTNNTGRVLAVQAVTHTIDYTSWGISTNKVDLLAHDKTQVDIVHDLWWQINATATTDAQLADRGTIDLAIQAITVSQDATIPNTRNKAALQTERTRIIAARAAKIVVDWTAFFEQDNNHTILFGKAGTLLNSTEIAIRDAWQGADLGLTANPATLGNHDSLADQVWGLNWTDLRFNQGNPINNIGQITNLNTANRTFSYTSFDITTLRVDLRIHDRLQINAAHQLWSRIADPSTTTVQLADGGDIANAIEAITDANDNLIPNTRNKAALRAVRTSAFAARTAAVLGAALRANFRAAAWVAYGAGGAGAAAGNAYDTLNIENDLNNFIIDQFNRITATEAVTAYNQGWIYGAELRHTNVASPEVSHDGGITWSAYDWTNVANNRAATFVRGGNLGGALVVSLTANDVSRADALQIDDLGARWDPALTDSGNRNEKNSVLMASVANMTFVQQGIRKSRVGIIFRANVHKALPDGGPGTTRPTPLTSPTDDVIIDNWFALTVPGGGTIDPGKLTPAQIQRLHTRSWNPAVILPVGLGSNDFTVNDRPTGAAIVPAVIGFTAVDALGEYPDFLKGRYWIHFFEQDKDHTDLFGITNILVNYQQVARKSWQAVGLLPTTRGPNRHNSQVDDAWVLRHWRDLTLGAGNPANNIGQVTALVPTAQTFTFTYTSHGQPAIVGVDPTKHNKNSLDTFNSLRKSIASANLSVLQEAETDPGSIRAAINNLASDDLFLPIGSRSADLEALRISHVTALGGIPFATAKITNTMATPVTTTRYVTQYIGGTVLLTIGITVAIFWKRIRNYWNGATKRK